MNWPRKHKTVVLGAELAAARKSEEERLAAGVMIPKRKKRSDTRSCQANNTLKLIG
jgi:hypothetical protein